MKTKKHLLAALALTVALGVAAQSAVQKSMLESFVKYAAIDSQSHDDSICTQGQRKMALALKADIEEAVSRSKVAGVDVRLSDETYLYVTIPANTKKSCPSMVISCHLDVTPEQLGTNIRPIVDTRNGHTIVRTDGTTLLGADDKCGCTIAVQLIRTLLTDKSIKHGVMQFAFCPNEDVGRAADAIDSTIFSPDILFDLDGEGNCDVTDSNFTARRFDVRFIGKDAHPGNAKAEGFGDAIAAAATFIADIPVEYRPENTEGTQGYIHPWNFEQKPKQMDVTVMTRVRYFDKAEGELFDRLLKEALADVARKHPNVRHEILVDKMQYENVAYTLYPGIKDVVLSAAAKIGKEIKFVPERGGTTASMFAVKGLKGGMCVFTGQHKVHTTNEYADLQEMEEAYTLMLEIIKQVATLK